MKKFGTPTAGAPGSDTEYVGFLAPGTPRRVGRSDLRVVVVPVVGWGWTLRVARECERGWVARRVAGSERELVGRAAEVGVGAVPVVGLGVVPVFDRVVVVELVEVVVGDVRVVVVDAVVVVVVVVVVVTGAGAAPAVVVGLVGVTDPEVEVETVGAGGAGAAVVVVTLAVGVVFDAPAAVVDVVVLAAHEFVSVMSLRSSDPAAAPSWLVTAVSSSLWPVTPAVTVTPAIVIDRPVSWS